MEYGEVTTVRLELDGAHGGEGRHPPGINTPGGAGLYQPAPDIPPSRDGSSRERLLSLLSAIDHLIVLQHGSPPFLATLGVPHHAAPHSEHICERRLDSHGRPNPREADENAALYALAVFETLSGAGAGCKLVIMAHATTHDPNKALDSPYCRELFAGPTRLIFECHGSKRERLHDLELSAGRNVLAKPLVFGRALAAALDYRYTLGAQSAPDRRQGLIFDAGGAQSEGLLELPARRTSSLVEAGRRGLPALHLEARPRFRRAAPDGTGPGPEGLALGRAIAACILSYVQPQT